MLIQLGTWRSYGLDKKEKERNTLQLVINWMVTTILILLLWNGRKYQLLWWTQIVCNIWEIVQCVRISGDQFMVISNKLDHIISISHNEDFWSLNFQKIRTFHIPSNFGNRKYNMIKKFIRIWPILTPPHVHDLMMDDANDVYKTHGNNLKDAIQLNDDSRTQKIERYDDLNNDKS